ncbi:MAG: alpha/beta hydrolase family protein [Eubacteriales bacterium]|nr:alpha/beta hydrolase family protein [Eubacteriales bacterium]
MAFAEVYFYSEILKMDTAVNVILPEERQGIGMSGDRRKSCPVLWLLHGRSDDHTTWMRRTSIERYAAPLGLMVVMPDAGYSRYLNMAHGQNYYDYIVRELPEFCRSCFPLMSCDREDNYIAGLSMGGGGAMYIGLKNPDKYSHICMLSTGGAIPLEQLWRDTKKQKKWNFEIYGTEDQSELTGGEYDILELIRKLPEKTDELPRVFHAMGTEDQRYVAGQAVKTAFESIPGNPYGYEYHEGPGNHEWAFWDFWIQKFLATLPAR